jgi:hypothetical protein
VRWVAVVGAALILVCVAPASAAPKTYSCAVTQTAAEPGYVGLHVTGNVPANAIPYLRIDGANEWTALHNIKGGIDDYTSRTTADLPAGSHTGEVIDYRHSDPANGVYDVIAICQFTVT